MNLPEISSKIVEGLAPKLPESVGAAVMLFGPGPDATSASVGFAATAREPLPALLASVLASLCSPAEARAALDAAIAKKAGT